jgi:hypothetical protein
VGVPFVARLFIGFFFICFFFRLENTSGRSSGGVASASHMSSPLSVASVSVNLSARHMKGRTAASARRHSQFACTSVFAVAVELVQATWYLQKKRI